MAQESQVSLPIENASHTVEPASRQTNNSGPAPSRPVALNTNNNFSIFDIFSNFMIDIRPLVESTRRVSNTRLTLPTWFPNFILNHTEPAAPISQNLTRQNSAAPPSATQSPNETVRAMPLHEPIVIENPHAQEYSESSETSSEHEVENGQTNITVVPDIGTENADNDSNDDPQWVDMREWVHFLIKYSPFYVILFLKFMYDSRETIITFAILLFSFAHCNITIKREHGKQVNRSIIMLGVEFILTSFSLTIVYFVYGREMILANLIMIPPKEERFDVWDLMWLVLLTDVILKIITVNIKVIITMLPVAILPFQKRGKVYLFIESVSQLYRSLVTIQPWMYFLSTAYDSSEKIVGMFLTSLYVICKAIEVLFRLRLFKNATWTLLQNVTLGTKPTPEQMSLAGECCPICHDDYNSPICLVCNHVFCEICISAWLDRDYTCPLCRAKVTDEPSWRDGSTTYEFQIY